MSSYAPYNETAICDVIRAPPSEIADVITTAHLLLHIPHFLSFMKLYSTFFLFYGKGSFMVRYRF